jgi:hypothetical protein
MRILETVHSENTNKKTIIFNSKFKMYVEDFSVKKKADLRLNGTVVAENTSWDLEIFG